MRRVRKLVAELEHGERLAKRWRQCERIQLRLFERMHRAQVDELSYAAAKRMIGYTSLRNETKRLLAKSLRRTEKLYFRMEPHERAALVLASLADTRVRRLLELIAELQGEVRASKWHW